MMIVGGVAGFLAAPTQGTLLIYLPLILAATWMLLWEVRDSEPKSRNLRVVDRLPPDTFSGRVDAQPLSDRGTNLCGRATRSSRSSGFPSGKDG